MRWFTVRWLVKHSATWWDKLMDMHSELWELVQISQRKPLGAKGEEIRSPHPSNCSNECYWWWDNVGSCGIGQLMGSLELLIMFISEWRSKCRSVCHVTMSFKLNMLGPIPAGQLAQRCGTVWSCLSCSKRKGLWSIWHWGKETRQTPKQFRLTFFCLRLIQGGDPPVMFFLAYTPHQLWLYN